MWGFFRKRKEGDLSRLASAYRCYLKVADREDTPPEANWKGGFGKAFNLLFDRWPTPNQSRRFQKIMIRRMKKNQTTDDAFIQAFNDFMDQKPLGESELMEVVRMGLEARGK